MALLSALFDLSEGEFRVEILIFTAGRLSCWEGCYYILLYEAFRSAYYEFRSYIGRSVAFCNVFYVCVRTSTLELLSLYFFATSSFLERTIFL